MDFWAEQQGHLPQYNKFNTVPSRSCAQNLYDRHQTAQYPVYFGEQRDKTIDSGYWPARDVTSWTNSEITAPTSPAYFPFNLERPIQQHYQDVGEHQYQDARDWTTYQQRERGMQREGWSYAPVHYKRDISKKNESNFRELEAWALRYSHSLPRRRRIEAELRGTMQDNVVERRDMQTQNLQEAALWDRASRQQAQNYYLAPPTSHNLDIKDKIINQTKLYSQPPNYNAPPPYNVQYKNVPMLQKWEKQSYELPQVVKKRGREMEEKKVCQVRTKELDVLQGNSPPQLVQMKSSSEASKIIEGRKFKLNKKSGGMTIFCLVSRIADTERETLPVSQKQSEVVHPKTSNISQPLKLADEVDFKTPVQTSTKAPRSPYSKLQAIPICKSLTDSLSKMADKDVPKTNEVSAFGKLAPKYPLWRRPSLTSSTETDNSATTCAKGNAQEILSKCSGNDDKESKKLSKETKDSDAMLMIDTTCVVVKMEVLKAPLKEQVHYLGSNEPPISGQNLASEGVQCNQDILPKQQHNDKAEELDKLEVGRKEMRYDVVEKGKSENLLPTTSELVPETLEECATRKIGLHESTKTQLQKEEIVDFVVKDSPMQNNDINKLEGEAEMKGLQNESLTTKIEDLQALQARREEDEVMEIGVLKEDSSENIENLERDSEVQKNKMAENLVQESNGDDVLSEDCTQPFEVDHFTGISTTLTLSKEQLDNDPLLTQSENLSPLNIYAWEDFEQPAAKITQSEVKEDIVCVGVHEKDCTPPPTSSIDVTAEVLQENELDFKDRDRDKEEDSEELGESNKAEHETDLRDEVSCSKKGSINGEEVINVRVSDLEMHEELMVQATGVNDVQNHVLCGEMVDASTLEILSENGQNQGKELTENDSVQLYGRNMADPKPGPTNEVSCIKEDTDVTNSDLEMHEEAIVQATEVNDVQKQEERSQKVDGSTLEIVSGNEQNQGKEEITEKASVELYGRNTKIVAVSCIEDESINGAKDTEVTTSDFVTHEEATLQVSKVKDLKEQVGSSQMEDATYLKEKLEEKETFKVDILVATHELEKEVQPETQNVLQKQFGCQVKACVNEGLLADDKVEEKLPSTSPHENLGIEPQTLTDPKVVEILPEDVEQNQDIIEKVNEELNETQLDEVSCIDVKDIDVTKIELDIHKEPVVKDNEECGQEGEVTCVKETLMAVEQLEKQDILERMHRELAVKVTEDFDVQQKVEREQIVEATCVKEQLEEAAILELASKLAKEQETQKDICLQDQNLVEISKTDVQDCHEDTDLQQQFKCEEALSNTFINDKGSNANAKDSKENEKSELTTEMCLSTKSKDILPQVHSLAQISGKDVNDSNLVYLPNSNLNNSAAILESSSSFMDNFEQPLMETFTSSDNCENTSCEQEKCPKSLWDAVNRIRKHTAPDSENEEEELTDNWDRESVAADYVFRVKSGNVSDEAVQQAVKEEEMQTGTSYEDFNMQDDIFSQCSNNSSEESEGTIVDDEFEAAEMTNVDSKAVCNKDQFIDGGEKDENASENGDTLNKNQTEMRPREKTAEASEMLEKL